MKKKRAYVSYRSPGRWCMTKHYTNELVHSLVVPRVAMRIFDCSARTDNHGKTTLLVRNDEGEYVSFSGKQARVVYEVLKRHYS